jgi:hypothetical protein
MPPSAFDPEPTVVNPLPPFIQDITAHNPTKPNAPKDEVVAT